jgi:hypothetical protein
MSDYTTSIGPKVLLTEVLVRYFTERPPSPRIRKGGRYSWLCCPTTESIPDNLFFRSGRSPGPRPVLSHVRGAAALGARAVLLPVGAPYCYIGTLDPQRGNREYSEHQVRPEIQCGRKARLQTNEAGKQVQFSGVLARGSTHHRP